MEIVALDGEAIDDNGDENNDDPNVDNVLSDDGVVGGNDNIVDDEVCDVVNVLVVLEDEVGTDDEYILLLLTLTVNDDDDDDGDDDIVSPGLDVTVCPCSSVAATDEPADADEAIIVVGDVSVHIDVESGAAAVCVSVVVDGNDVIGKMASTRNGTFYK
ncbi:MAG: hypothetical protein ABW185_24335 [Sedimenticola sp.]